jgi:uncharacterized protein (TIGR00299 family) protein
MEPVTLYLESFAGISGDMFTAAFLDAGLVDPDVIRGIPGRLGFTGVSVEIGTAMKADAQFTSVRVILPDGQPDEGTPLLSSEHFIAEKGAHHQHHHHHHSHTEHEHHDRSHADHHHHHYSDLVERIEGSTLSTASKEFALAVFRHLAEAEAESHGVAVEDVAFHEVGAMDSVVDVAMAGVCVEAVGAHRILASPVKLGRGTVEIHHGTYPVPPPASARLSAGMPVSPVPPGIKRQNVELSTPTGLAILKALDPEFAEGWPGGTLVAQGAGAGSMDLDSYPNIFRVALLRETALVSEHRETWPPAGVTDLPFESDPVVELRCNVDDQTGERTGWLVETALEKGALDAWVVPVVGKKGRPAVSMAFLVRDSDTAAIADLLLRESTTFGVRFSRWDRLVLPREMETRQTPHGPVDFKVGRTTEGEVLKEKPEFDDLRKAWKDPPRP